MTNNDLFQMQCDDCKLKNECLGCGAEELKGGYVHCTDYICENPVMPAHTHPLSKPLFGKRDNSVNGGSNDMLGNIDNATGQRN